MSNASQCPMLGPALLSTYNLNPLEISPGLAIKANQVTSPVAPADSVWFTAATTTSVANDHGILVNLDPETSLFRLWDLDTRLGTATGIGANFLAQDVYGIWVSSAEPVVHRLDPLARGQWTWTLPVDPFTNTIRGITVMPDGSLVISSSNSAGVPGSLYNLNPTTDIITQYQVPSEPAAFSGALAPDGSFWFCEFETDQLARFDLTLTADNLAEYSLPTNTKPFRVFVDAQGIVWFAGETVIGQFDPATGSLMEFQKEGVLPSDFAAMVLPPFLDTGQADPPLFVLADSNPFVDVLCASPTTQTFLPERSSTLSPLRTAATPAPSRPVLTLARLTPELSAVAPVDPGQFSRYAVETPTLAATQQGLALYAIGSELLTSTFRAYKLFLTPDPE